MKIISIIPARMGSSRFPGKPMADILGMPMIGHVYKRVKLNPVLDEVYVATCDKEIYDYITSIGGKAIMTSDCHERCSDRCAEAMLKIEKQENKKVDIIIFAEWKTVAFIFYKYKRGKSGLQWSRIPSNRWPS